MAAPAVATTVAPRALASWTAKWPTPPAAPWISTVPSAPTSIRSSICSAVSAASGTAAASAELSDGGLHATWVAGRTHCSA